MNAPRPIFTFMGIETNGGFPFVKVEVSFHPDDVSLDHKTPSVDLKFPLNLLGRSLDEIQQESISLAQGCIREEALVALTHHP